MGAFVLIHKEEEEIVEPINVFLPKRRRDKNSHLVVGMLYVAEAKPIGT